MIKINYVHAKEHRIHNKNLRVNKLLISIFRYICEIINNRGKMGHRGRVIQTGIVALIIIAGAALVASCEKYSYIVETVNPVDTVYFQTEIQPIFTANCITCHRGTRNPDLRQGNSYESLTTGGYVTLPAESSRLYSKITSSSHEAFTLPVEKQKILVWIQQGARDN